MPTRKVKVAVNKTAKGESFTKELEKFGRYIVGISLESLKTVGKYDLANRTNEFFYRSWSRDSAPARPVCRRHEAGGSCPHPSWPSIGHRHPVEPLRNLSFERGHRALRHGADAG